MVSCVWRFLSFFLHVQDHLRQHEDVYILHPEYTGVVVGTGRSGVSWKTQKKSNPEKFECEIGVQMVHLSNVFEPGVVPMYASQQPKIKTLEDAVDTLFDRDGWVKWHTNYLVLIK